MFCHFTIYQFFASLKHGFSTLMSPLSPLTFPPIFSSIMFLEEIPSLPVVVSAVSSTNLSPFLLFLTCFLNFPPLNILLFPYPLARQQSFVSLFFIATIILVLPPYSSLNFLLFSNNYSSPFPAISSSWVILTFGSTLLLTSIHPSSYVYLSHTDSYPLSVGLPTHPATLWT